MVEPFLSGLGFHLSGEDAGGGAVGNDNNTGANSGGIELVHTSHSGPNCRRNKSENVRSKTKTGSKLQCRCKQSRRCNKSRKRQRIPPMRLPMPKRSKINSTTRSHRDVL